MAEDGDRQEGSEGFSDPELDDLGFAIPEFRVPSSKKADDAELAGESSSASDEAEQTQNISPDELEEELELDAKGADAPFDRSELVKTVRMDAFDRASVEAMAQKAQVAFDGVVEDQRFAPDVLIFPPRVLTKKWQDGAVVKPNGAAAGPPEDLEEEEPISDPDEAIELDAEADVVVEEPKPPPKPKPGRRPQQTGPLFRSTGANQQAPPTPAAGGAAASKPPPAAAPAEAETAAGGEDDDLNGIVQELLDEKKKPAQQQQQQKRPVDNKRVNWFVDVFSEEYLRTLPKDLHRQTEREVRFMLKSLGVQKGARILDLACGFGRHSVELAARDFEVAGLDVSMPLLKRALAEAQRRSLTIKFIHGDMRELSFNEIFDACVCWQTSFGYFDDRTNLAVAQGIQRALKPGGRFVLDMVNRDYVVAEMPSRTWWEGHECVFLEEVEFDYGSSVLHTKRSFIYEDGSPPQEFSSYVRLYSLHELTQMLAFAGLRIIEVSGAIHHRNQYLGATSQRLIVLAEKVVKS